MGCGIFAVFSVFFSLSAETSKTTKMAMSGKHNVKLDILRGFAAISVVFYHFNLLPDIFDRSYSINHIGYVFPGHLSVLVFFVLSGFVIKRNTSRLDTTEEISKYLQKRIVRIFPVFLISFLFTVVLTMGKYNAGTLLSNLCLISVANDTVIPENGPVWSLQYEIFYYLIFVAILNFKINIKTLTILSISISLLLFAVATRLTIHPLVIGVVIGFTFWISGALLSDLSLNQTGKLTHSRVVAVFLFLFCIQKFNPYEPVTKALHISILEKAGCSEFQKTISYFDVYFFAMCAALVMAMTGFVNKWFYRVVYIVYIVSGAVLACQPILFPLHRMVEKDYLVPATIFCLSFYLWFANKDFTNSVTKSMKKTAALSDISYAIYIIHMPLLYLFGNYSSNSPLLFSVKFLGYWIVLLLAAYVLELKYQPLIKRMLGQRQRKSLS